MAKSDKRRLRKVRYTGKRPQETPRRSVFNGGTVIHAAYRVFIKNRQRRRSNFLRRYQS